MATVSGENFARNLLMKQYKDISKAGIENFSIGLVDDTDIYTWQILMEGADDTLYEGGFFKCTMVFPKDYPNSPPVFKFISKMWHPNIYPDGTVCISILHDAKHDPYNEQELMTEKWRPVLGIESVLISIQSLLAHPNLDSPANIDAAKQLREDIEAYNKRVRNLTRRTLEEL